MEQKKDITPRILVLDDNEDVLKELHAELRSPLNVGTRNFQPQVICVRVQVVLDGNGEYRVSDETARDIVAASSAPFNCIISDWAFIGDQSKNAQLRTLLVDSGQRNIKSQELRVHTILGLADVVQAVRRRSDQTDSATNFLNHDGKLIVYTYSPYPFDGHFNGKLLDRRKDEIRTAFGREGTEWPVEFLLAHDVFQVPGGLHKTEVESGDDERADIFRKFISHLVAVEVAHRIRVFALIQAIRRKDSG